MADDAFDVVVIGCGPAGIAAASICAEQGLRAAVVDEAPRPGGQIWRHVSRNALPRVARIWMHRLGRSGARVLSGHSVLDVVRSANSADTFMISIAPAAGPSSGTGPRVLRAKQIIVATGARERFVPFPGWTLPGVFGVGGGQALLKAGASMHGRTVVVAGSGPLLLPVAAALSLAGARVTHIIEQARARDVIGFARGLWRTPSRLAQAAAYRAQSMRARYMMGAWVTEATGDSRVRSVRVSNGRTTVTHACDVLCVGYGLIPSPEIPTLLGCDLHDGAVRVDAKQQTSIAGVYAAGESTGVAGVDAALAEGTAAALAAAGARADRTANAVIARERAFAARMDVAFSLRQELRHLVRDDTIICRCEDVRAGAIARCASMREAKLHTRAGMGPCQGRVCGPAMQLIYGWNGSSVRPPAVPASISSFLQDTTAAAGG
jgi:NADPH-dependent 2,4-dienoyl-CoA reductase/sulfur reductase-like enzyme